jgi:hypothetical protein
MRNLPPTTLEAVEQRFVELSGPPTPVTLDGCCVGAELPQRPIPLDELRIIMLKRKTSWLIKGAVWSELVRRAQDQGEPWITAAMGMAMPMLKKIAGNAARGFHGDIADFDSEIVEGFLYALSTVDPLAPNLYTSLRFMAQRYATEARASEDRILGQSTEYDEAIAAKYRPRVLGHPDLVLARAVRDQGLSDQEAGLIARAHLDGEAQTSLAEACGVSPYLLRQQLARAQHRLVRFLSHSMPRPAA